MQEVKNDEFAVWDDAKDECDDAGNDDRDSAPDVHTLEAWSP